MDIYKMGLRPISPSHPDTPDPQHHRYSFKFGMWQKLHHFFGRDDHQPSSDQVDSTVAWREESEQPKEPPPTTLREWPSRPVGIGLPRQTTFKRQNSEKRERLCPVQPLPVERRAASTSQNPSEAISRQRSKSSPPHVNTARNSAPAIASILPDESIPPLPIPSPEEDVDSQNLNVLPDQPYTDHVSDYEIPRPPRPDSRTSSHDSFDDDRPLPDDRMRLHGELDTKWILNLSMHFRDKSDREKFFVTYAQNPTLWRRVTVSCDYRNAEPGSLETDLKELQFQRDKNMQIYEAIRDSLPSIQFYDTVTNLKLETSDDRLHVHVTEDVNEIIPYPAKSSVSHILNDSDFQPKEVRECDLTFGSHLSGFVYKVGHRGQTYIKKEIPGPDTVDEFLYEINALHALGDSENVIHLEGIVVDNAGERVKGLLISYAERGAVVDLLYDFKGQIPWSTRLKWAKQVISGLSDIHGEGYVQGDFTLSNIVVDHNNDAKIIDINRRGCPVGWEPPEIAKKIASNQRISMYIGEKSDLYQLGMTLWALAMDDDEPERHDTPLSTAEFPSEVPSWFRNIVRICLSTQPRDRLSAKDLIKMFPIEGEPESCEDDQVKPRLTLKTHKRYIDPAAAVERDDIERLKLDHVLDKELLYSPESSRDDYTFTYPKSSNYDLDHDRDSVRSEFERPRGRRPAANTAHLTRREHSERRRHHDHLGDTDDEYIPYIVEISPEDVPEYDEVELDGHPYLVSRGTFNEEEIRILKQRAQQDESNSLSYIGKRLGSPLTFNSGVSVTSENTPRNSHLSLTVTDSYKEIPSLESESVDHDAHVPRQLPETETLTITEILPRKSSDRVRPSNYRNPPSMPCKDSGYEEPAHFDELLDIEKPDLHEVLFDRNEAHSDAVSPVKKSFGSIHEGRNNDEQYNDPSQVTGNSTSGNEHHTPSASSLEDQTEETQHMIDEHEFQNNETQPNEQKEGETWHQFPPQILSYLQEASNIGATNDISI